MRVILFREGNTNMTRLPPSLDVFGSFFPIWMFCLIVGIVLTLAIRPLLVWTRLDPELRPRVVVYPSMVALFACTIWLIWFRN